MTSNQKRTGRGSHARARIARLAKRRDYLRQRIAAAAEAGRETSYDRAEESALSWAIDVLHRHVAGRSALARLRAMFRPRS